MVINRLFILMIGDSQDSGGTISRVEMKSALRSLKLDSKQIEKLMLLVDDDGDGEINFTEFLQLFADVFVNLENDERMYEEAFRSIAGEKKISAGELKTFMSRLGDQMTDLEAQDMVDLLDSDGDG